MSLALSAIGLTARDATVVRGVYLLLEPVGWSMLVPLSFASLVTGLLQSLGSHWGLLRHYWVLIKLAMNLFASAILLLYMQTLGYLADTARAAASTSDIGTLRTPSPLVHSAAAVVLLIVALVLSVFKPRGLTPWGERRSDRTNTRDVQRTLNQTH